MVTKGGHAWLLLMNNQSHLRHEVNYRMDAIDGVDSHTQPLTSPAPPQYSITQKKNTEVPTLSPLLHSTRQTRQQTTLLTLSPSF